MEVTVYHLDFSTFLQVLSVYLYWQEVNDWFACICWICFSAPQLSYHKLEKTCCETSTSTSIVDSLTGKSRGDASHPVHVLTKSNEVCV